MKNNPRLSIQVLILIFSMMSVNAQRDLGYRPTDSGGPLLPEQAAYDVTFYDLDMAIFPDEQSIKANLTVTANIVHPLEWFVLHLDMAYMVSAVELIDSDKATPVNFSHREGQVWSHLRPSKQPGEAVAIKVTYHGKPPVAKAPPWVGGFTWDKTASGQHWFATSCQNDGADLWWPCKDHPSDEPDSMALSFTVPKPLVAASNGKLRGVTENQDGARTYNWFVSTPINNYGVALNVAPYRTIEETYTSIAGETIPVTYWVLPENVEKGKVLMKEILQHLAYFEKMLGPYPFRADKYGVAETPFLGMEHQTIIAYGNNYRSGPWGYDILHHHELGHEWWGTLVTALDWRDFWLHEGLCSYMHPLYMEHLQGREAYLNALQGSRSRIKNDKPVAPRTSHTTTEIYFTAPDYTSTHGGIFNKGVWVLHTLRYLIGDDAFFKSLRRMAYPTPEMETMIDGRQCRFATTDDFVALVESISGMKLGWFFEVYIRQPILPRLVKHVRENALVLRWETPENLPFPLPVEVEIAGKVQRIAMGNGENSLKLPAGARYKIDPNQWLLMEQVE